MGVPLAAVQLVHSWGAGGDAAHGDFTEGELLINLRAEGDPEVLAASVMKALVKVAEASPGLTLEQVHLEHFRPGQPKPTHRVAKV
jgi:hypothetical protein